MAKSSLKKLAKELSGTVKIDYKQSKKMTPEELQEYIKMKNSGSGSTKNKKGIIERKSKYRKKYDL